MPRTVGVGVLLLIALTACTHFNGKPSPAAEAPPRSAPDTPHATLPAGPTAAGAPAAAAPGPPAAESRAASPPVPSPVRSAAKPAETKAAGNANPTSPRGTGSQTGSSSKPLPVEQHGAAPAAQTASAQPAARPPALDLAGLEQRLKDTHAIGLFTKLSLKNQVDDLLGALRAFHGGQIPPPLPELRQRYDLLLLKVLTLLQDGDPPLASAIAASREAIWGLLSDRNQFQKFQG